MIFPKLPKTEHCLFQYSNLEAFEARQYDGALTISELKQYGDFGLGCFSALDGEIISFENKYYHASSDGRVRPALEGASVSGAYSCFFAPQFQGNISEQLNFSNLHTYATKKSGIKNQPFYAIRLDGFFSKINVRKGVGSYS